MFTKPRFHTFIRSCNSFETMVTARKSWRGKYLTEEGAREACDNYNNNRNATQIKRGTKMEYTEK
jgi:hypothetical protein